MVDKPYIDGQLLWNTKSTLSLFQTIYRQNDHEHNAAMLVHQPLLFFSLGLLYACSLFRFTLHINVQISPDFCLHAHTHVSEATNSQTVTTYTDKHRYWHSILHFSSLSYLYSSHFSPPSRALSSLCSVFICLSLRLKSSLRLKGLKRNLIQLKLVSCWRHTYQNDP